MPLLHHDCMSDCVRFTTAGMPSQRTDGFGAWSGEGCMLTDETTTQVTCTCNRLGTFAVIQVSCPLNVWSSTTLCCFHSMHPRASTSSLVPSPYFRSNFHLEEKYVTLWAKAIDFHNVTIHVTSTYEYMAVAQPTKVLI